MNFTTTTAKLIPAAELASAAQPKSRNYDTIIMNLNKKLLENETNGELDVLPLPPDVVKMLEEAGYTVKFYRAMGMGDMDSHRITWRNKA